MALQFLIGGSGAGKSRAVFSRIIRESMEAPARRFLVLVPEQSTMETQRQIVELHPRRGIMNIEVLSITRLAYRVFAEVGFQRETLLEEIGKTFLLEKIALEQKKNLGWYRDLLAKPEFLAELKAVISEFLLYGISPEQLEEAASKRRAGGEVGKEKGESLAELSSACEKKLSDLSLLLGAFLTRLRGSYMTAEELPEKLGELADSSSYFKDSVVVLDGFTGFTPLQLRLMERILPLSRDMYVTVTMDADEDPYGTHSMSSLFAMSCRLIRDLTAVADRKHIPVMPFERIRGEGCGRHADAAPLAFLEKNLFRLWGRECETAAEQAVRLIECGSPLEEVQRIAREICTMVREEGYRYRDFALVTGDLGTYAPYVREIFPRWGIPCFVDEKRALKANPFIEFLRAALESVSDNYSYTAMFRMLKAGILPFDTDSLDHLENYVIGCGVRGKKRWREPFVRHYRGEDIGELPKLNKLREEICGLLDPLSDVLTNYRCTVREKTAALYEFCLRIRAEEMLRARAEEYEKQGFLEKAREYAQVWPYVVSFLDKLVSLLGDETISMRDYRELIEAGFLEARVAVIPPGNDQVLIGDMERSRLSGVRVLFFAGVNDGLIPKSPSGGGVLTEADRSFLKGCGIELKPSVREQLFIDRFYLYLTLTKPSEKLILSYAVRSASGDPLREAGLIPALRCLFPDLEKECGEEDLIRRAEREESSVALAAEILSLIDEKAPDLGMLELFAWYRHHPHYEERIEKLLDFSSVRPKSDRIGNAVTRALYGDVLYGSASRLELYISCRFAHFLAYGMRLKERQEYAFTGLDLGSVMHRSLELFSKMAEERGGWAALASDDELRTQLASVSVAEAAKEYESGIFSDSARDHYQLKRIRRLMEETVWAQARQLEAGDFVPAGSEEAFRGMDSGLLADLVLSDGSRMCLTGRIDRIDTFDRNGRTYYKILDYKTGSVDFDLAKVYYGLQLQLVFYANAAEAMLRRGGKDPCPAGMFYCAVKDPVVEYKAAETEDDTKSRILAELKLSGAALKDKEVLSHLDRNLIPGNKSKIIPVTLKKDGDPDSYSKVLGEEDFQALGRHVQSLIRKSGEEIREGLVSINPYSYKEETACDYCPYRGVCGFDPRLGIYGYRKLSGMKAAEVFDMMEKEKEKEEDKGYAGSKLDS